MNRHRRLQRRPPTQAWRVVRRFVGEALLR